jgi:hypothetical protein
MTTKSDEKTRARARAAATGESYSTALAAVRREHVAAMEFFGGLSGEGDPQPASQEDVAALRAAIGRLAPRVP